MAAISIAQGVRGARTGIEPFRSSAADLVDLFEAPDAAKPEWHRERAAVLRNEAIGHPVAAVSDAYCRLAARHVATARLLEGAACKRV